MYFIFGVSVAIIARRVRPARSASGGSASHSRVTDHLGARITNLLTMGAGTSRVKNDRYAGVMHWCIYSSFIVLTLVTHPPRARRLPAAHLRQRRRARLPQGRHLPRLQPRRRHLRRSSGSSASGMAVFRRYVTPPAQAHLGPPRRRGRDHRRAARLRALHRHPRRRPAHRRQRNPGRPRKLVVLVARGLGRWRRSSSGVSARHALDLHQGCWWFHVVARLHAAHADGDDEVPPHRLRARERLPQAPDDAALPGPHGQHRRADRIRRRPWRGQAPGLHLEAALRCRYLRALRPLHRRLPRLDRRPAALADGHHPGHEDVHEPRRPAPHRRARTRRPSSRASSSATTSRTSRSGPAAPAAPACRSAR